MIRKVLIANRGEIARRIIRAAHSLGISTAVVYSDADAASLFVHEADEGVHLTGNSPADTYLVAELILDAARAVGADAVHPGYGFLSENADFAAACVDAGLTFVGPSEAAIRQMGDKLGAKKIMAAHGVPTLSSVTIGDDPHEQTEVALGDVGLPAIIKASAGGGGRGMRIVTDSADLPAALESARREAQAAFGDPTVFIERYLSPARHIEVQVVADRYGSVATLFERECSIQRRHQKLVEESPSPFVDSELRMRLRDAATKAADAVGYEGVGTVEFVAGPDRSFAFLEMNTRLQVEHPVTELVTGVDLVRLQFKVAAGEPLERQVLDADISGHAIEVRLCAEDAGAGYLPASGTFELFELGGDGIRLDAAVATGSEVSPYYDSMVAKVIARGDTRQEAAARLARCLEHARIHGVTTNRDLLIRVLRSDAFLAGDTTTDFLERVPGMTEPRTTPEVHRQHAVIAAIALDRAARRGRSVQAAVPPGWRNNRAGLERVDLRAPGLDIGVEYDPSGRTATFVVDGEPVDVELHSVDEAAVEATFGGVRRRYQVHTLPGVVLVDSQLGFSSFEPLARFPVQADVVPESGLTAPMPGRVVRVLVSVGQTVAAGDPLLVLEAMKMEHTISSPGAGEVAAVNVTEGEQVERGAVLAAVEAS